MNDCLPALLHVVVVVVVDCGVRYVCECATVAYVLTYLPLQVPYLTYCWPGMITPRRVYLTIPGTVAVESAQRQK